MFRKQVGNFMHYISWFIVGFTVGFVRVWQISLVTLSIVPSIAFAGGFYAYGTFGLISKVRKAYVRASEIAEENFECSVFEGLKAILDLSIIVNKFQIKKRNFLFKNYSLHYG